MLKLGDTLNTIARRSKEATAFDLARSDIKTRIEPIGTITAENNNKIEPVSNKR